MQKATQAVSWCRYTPHFLIPASVSCEKRLCDSEMAAVSVSADGHFNIPEGTDTINSDSWRKWGVDTRSSI